MSRATTTPSTAFPAATATAPPAERPTSRHRIFLRWMASFAGFPLGGFTAFLLVGPVDSLGAALLGGFVTGALLGAVQAWALGRARPRPVVWVLATAVGLAAGLALGADLVGYGTELVDLVLQGAVTGVVVGAAQAAVLLRPLGALALAWPVLLGGIWAVGWAVTTAAGIDVGQQFTVFGSRVRWSPPS